MRVGVLHTVPALVPVFDGLLTERRRDLDIVHTADASLLSRAVASGITDDVVADIRTHVEALRDAGASAVLVTCSSIGEAATDAAATVGVPLMRVDAAMARTAVERARAAAARRSRADAGARAGADVTARSGGLAEAGAGNRGGHGRILVLATLAATLGPTSRLVQAAARRADADSADLRDLPEGAASGGDLPEGAASGGDVDVIARVVGGAADARAAGDHARHDRLIAEAIAEAGDVDVIVLAQASMATGAGDDSRVLTSPQSGAAAFVASLEELP